MTADAARAHAVAAAGLASTAEVRVWTACSVLGLIAVYAAIRSGWSRRFKDPSLTLAQILYSIACCAVAFVIAGPARGVTLPILAIILMFGIFGLTTRVRAARSVAAIGSTSGTACARPLAVPYQRLLDASAFISGYLQRVPHSRAATALLNRRNAT